MKANANHFGTTQVLLCALGQVYVALSYNSRGRRFSSRGHLRDIFPIHCADHSIFEYREMNNISGDLSHSLSFELVFSYFASVTYNYYHIYLYYFNQN